MQIFVIGMHRSGTSTVARLLNMMGIYFGGEGTSTGANEENPKGFWERKDVRALNDFILQSNGFDWNHLGQFNSTESFNSDSLAKFHKDAKKLILGMDAFRPWFLKEPRFCVTFPLWKKHLELPLCIYVYRNPVEVAKSLSKRNGFPLHYGLALWEKYNLLALSGIKDVNTIPVSYNQLIKDSYQSVETLFVALVNMGISNIRQPSEKEVKAFISNDLYRNTAEDAEMDILTVQQLELYDRIKKGKLHSSFITSKNSEKAMINYEEQLLKLKELEEALKKKEHDVEALRRESQVLLQQKETDLAKARNQLLIEVKKKDEELEIARLNMKKKDEELEIVRLDMKKKEKESSLIKEESSLIKIETKEKEKKLSHVILEAGKKEEELSRLRMEIKNKEDEIITLKHQIDTVTKVHAEVSTKLNYQSDQLRLLEMKVVKAHVQLEESKKLIDYISKDAGDRQDRIVTLEKKNIEASFQLRINEDLILKKQKSLDEALKKLGHQHSMTTHLEKLKRDQDQKISLLTQHLGERNLEIERLHKQVIDKDKIILDYWNHIQSMRIKNRLLSLIKLRPFKKKADRILANTEKKILQYQKLIRQSIKAIAISRFVKKSFDHTLSPETPKVSIIIVNRNGLSHLKRLFDSWHKNTIYGNYEIIVFDNASTDGSVEYLKNLPNLTVRIIESNTNQSFSNANNTAAIEAVGELLLFLNNDVIPIYGWLNQMVKLYLVNKEDAGLIGAKLVYPINSPDHVTVRLQHTGIGFREETGFVRPYNLDNGKEFFQVDHKENFPRPSLTAACVLVSKNRFNEVGGFDSGYVYGYEDVDLGLKLHKKGYHNRLASGAFLYHFEFGTQSVQSSSEVAKRRRLNIEHFRKKWYRKLLNSIWHEKVENATPLFYTERRLQIGLVVTETGDDAAAGDFFTAKELAIEFVRLGWQVNYYALRNGNWYEIDQNTDVLIVLLHGYDLSKIVCKNSALIKVAWIRNWFEKFSGAPWFGLYDVVLASSKLACQYIYDKTGKFTHYFPIATNEKRFDKKNDYESAYVCDYCFTGSYWNDPREIVEVLQPEKLSRFKFHLYGKNWEKVQKLKPYARGFVTYEDIPKVYSNTRILIDDANRVTKPWGSVNSRVFDAIMANVLVITNGILGSEDAFDGKLPYYKNAEDLQNLLEFYLQNEDVRLRKVEELKEIVKSKHTYIKRAYTFKSILEGYYEKSIVIKVPVPKMEVAKEWGDYHFAMSLRKEFEKKGFRVKIDILPEWTSSHSFEYANVLVLRGLSQYTPQKFQFNMIWNISHPDKILLEEFQLYDHIFIASKIWTEQLRNYGLKKVDCLLQCTDPEIFKPPIKGEEEESEILFVGNSRGVNRKILVDLLPTDHRLSVYGAGWKGLIDDKYIKGNHIDNKKLYKYYGGAKILLNDHWEDMRIKGFISNRIFDALACNAIIVSDDVPGLHALFNNSVRVYKTPDELREIINSFLKNDVKIEDNMSIHVRTVHTFTARVEELIKVISEKKRLI